MSAPLHILYVEFGYPHPHGGGGAGTFVQLAGRELVRRGHQVSVIAAHCPQCGPQQEDQGVRVYRPQTKGPLHWYLGRLPGLKAFAMITRSLESSWRVARTIENIHRQQPVDLLEFSDGGDVWHTLRHTIPYVAHLHGSRYTFLRLSGRPVTRGDWWDRRLGLWCIRHADLVISPSRAMLEAVQAEAGIAFPGAVVLPYPLDPRLLSGALTDERGASQTAPVRVFFAARNDTVKGGDVLIRAIPLVRARFPETEFCFFGYQPTPELAQLAGPTASFSPFLPREQLLQEYACADICVVPSYWDNSPNTIYEAMASGKPVIVARAGGMPELIVENESGLVFEPGSSDQLANALLTLLAAPQKRLAIGRAARQRILELSEPSANLEKRLAHYLRLLAR